MASIVSRRLYRWFGTLVALPLLEGPFRAYRSKHLIFRLAQSQSLLGRIFSEVLGGSNLSELVRDYDYMTSNIDRNRLSPGQLADLMDGDTFGGVPEFKNYADIDHFGGDYRKVPEQQRGMLVDLVEKAISELDGNITVVEIGTGNGDVIRYLSERHNNVRFVGIDFSVTNANQKHGHFDNAEFQRGYSLDLLAEGQCTPDIVFASSTFFCMFPKELASFLDVMRKSRCSQIIISDPNFGGYCQTNDTLVKSQYMHQHAWFHNYAGYLRMAGFEPVDFDTHDYKPDWMRRPDAKQTLIRASRID
jgi:hypothetical protein